MKTPDNYVVNDCVIECYVMVFIICKYVSIHYQIHKFLPAGYPCEVKVFALHVGSSVRGWHRNNSLLQSIKNNYEVKPTCFLLGIPTPLLCERNLHSSLPSVNVKNARSYTDIPSIYATGVMLCYKQNFINFFV
jgi:hypothetical protein